MSYAGLQDAQTASLWLPGSTPQPQRRCLPVGLTFIATSAMLPHMNSLLHTGSGMFSARVGRGRPGGDEKRFLININRLFEAGALDVYQMPIYMKKNRVGIRLNVVVRQQDEAKLANLL